MSKSCDESPGVLLSFMSVIKYYSERNLAPKKHQSLIRRVEGAGTVNDVFLKEDLIVCSGGVDDLA